MYQEAPIQKLAERICANAKVVGDFCDATPYPHHSPQKDVPDSLLPDNAPQNVRVAQQSILEAAVRIQQLSTDPSEFLTRQAIQFQQFVCLGWLCHFRVIFHVPMQGSTPYSEVAIACGVPESQLKAVARMAMTNGFLCETSAGELAHSSTSAPFVTNPNLYNWALYMRSASAPTAAKLVEATEKWGSTESKNQTAYNLAMGTDLPFFDHLAEDPEMTKQFAGYMKNVTASSATSLKHLLSGYDWASLNDATVVDVGGSTGHASIALATAYPELGFVVQDLPDTLAASQPSLDSLPDSVARRIRFQGHDFFTPQATKGADIYLLRMIIHDWPFTQAVTILKHLVDVLKPGARLIIMDTVLPRPGSIPATQEAVLRVRDLTMRQTFNSKERELDDWTTLFAAVDPMLRIVAVVQPPGSVMAVMEVVRDAKPQTGSQYTVPDVNHATTGASGALQTPVPSAA